MARKPFTTTIDENMQQEFRQTCNERQEKMNDVLEAFMKSYIDGEFTIEKQVIFTLKKTK